MRSCLKPFASQTPALQHYGTNSVIAIPSSGSRLSSRTIRAKGYAISSGKSLIAKVEVILLRQGGADEDVVEKADASNKWQNARLEGSEYRFAWTLWTIELQVPDEFKEGEKVAIISRAGERKLVQLRCLSLLHCL